VRRAQPDTLFLEIVRLHVARVEPLITT